MILAAGLLVLLGLGLFIGGLLTGATELYWACVATCVAAAGLLLLARRQLVVSSSGGPRTADAQDAAPVQPPQDLPEPDIEEVEVTDLLLVVDLKDEVLVIDEHPRYHLPGCRHLSGRTPIPLPLDEARSDGFTPCALCAPDRHLADRERARKSARG